MKWIDSGGQKYFYSKLLWKNSKLYYKANRHEFMHQAIFQIDYKRNNFSEDPE